MCGSYGAACMCSRLQTPACKQLVLVGPMQATAAGDSCRQALLDEKGDTRSGDAEAVPGPAAAGAVGPAVGGNATGCRLWGRARPAPPTHRNALPAANSVVGVAVGADSPVPCAVVAILVKASHTGLPVVGQASADRAARAEPSVAVACSAVLENWVALNALALEDAVAWIAALAPAGFGPTAGAIIIGALQAGFKQTTGRECYGMDEAEPVVVAVGPGLASELAEQLPAAGMLRSSCSRYCQVAATNNQLAGSAPSPACTCRPQWHTPLCTACSCRLPGSGRAGKPSPRGLPYRCH